MIRVCVADADLTRKGCVLSVCHQYTAIELNSAFALTAGMNVLCVNVLHTCKIVPADLWGIINAFCPYNELSVTAKT